jgi:hypothetical protein
MVVKLRCVTAWSWSCWTRNEQQGALEDFHSRLEDFNVGPCDADLLVHNGKRLQTNPELMNDLHSLLVLGQTCNAFRKKSVL